MATSSNAIGTSSTAIFNGTSRYAQDFANVVSRANAIASLPIKLMTNDKDELTAQSGDMKTLNDSFTALQSAVQGIQDALGGSSFQATYPTPRRSRPASGMERRKVSTRSKWSTPAPTPPA